MQHVPVRWPRPHKIRVVNLRVAKLEKHDHAITKARGPSQLARFALAVRGDGGMIRSRVQRDPSFFFIIWPNR